MMYKVSNNHSSISLGMNLKHMNATSHISNINGLPITIHNITNEIKKTNTPVSAAICMTPGSF